MYNYAKVRIKSALEWLCKSLLCARIPRDIGVGGFEI